MLIVLILSLAQAKLTLLIDGNPESLDYQVVQHLRYYRPGVFFLQKADCYGDSYIFNTESVLLVEEKCDYSLSLPYIAQSGAAGVIYVSDEPIPVHYSHQIFALRISNKVFDYPQHNQILIHYDGDIPRRTVPSIDLFIVPDFVEETIDNVSNILELLFESDFVLKAHIGANFNQEIRYEIDLVNQYSSGSVALYHLDKMLFENKDKLSISESVQESDNKEGSQKAHKSNKIARIVGNEKEIITNEYEEKPELKDLKDLKDLCDSKDLSIENPLSSLYINDVAILSFSDLKTIICENFEEKPKQCEIAFKPFKSSRNLNECSDGCRENNLNTGICTESCNNEACNYDFGDCCPCSSSELGNKSCNPTCSTPECFYDHGDCCTCNIAYLGNGECDEECNNEFCFYDYGDCKSSSEEDDSGYITATIVLAVLFPIIFIILVCIMICLCIGYAKSKSVSREIERNLEVIRRSQEINEQRNRPVNNNPQRRSNPPANNERHNHEVLPHIAENSIIFEDPPERDIQEVIAEMLFPDVIRSQELEYPECSICLNEFLVGQEIKRTQCFHIFHADCIDQWVTTAGWEAICPNCNFKILFDNY